MKKYLEWLLNSSQKLNLSKIVLDYLFQKWVDPITRLKFFPSIFSAERAAELASQASEELLAKQLSTMGADAPLLKQIEAMAKQQQYELMQQQQSNSFNQNSTYGQQRERWLAQQKQQQQV